MAMRGVAERPPGLLYRPDVLDPVEEADLLAWCASLETEPMVMHGVASRRRVRHFGVRYDAASWRTSPADPVPRELMALRGVAARLGEVEARTLAEALVTCYPPGAGIGWHRDATAFGPVVVGVSLGADAVMRFQRRAAGGERRVFEQPLARRSAYVLGGAARSAWQHSVPAVTDERWSVTFRQLRRTSDARDVSGYGAGEGGADMTTTPDEHSPTPDDHAGDPDGRPDGPGTPGVEVGMTDGEGSTFEPEEDPEGHAEP